MRLSHGLGWIGIDVGTHSVKIAQVAREGASVRLHRAAAIQRATPWHEADGLAREQPLPSSAEIKAALECGGFVGRDAICSLPMNVCELRGLNVPPGNERERRVIVGGELGEEWDEDGVPMEFDYWELETSAGEKGSDAYNVSVLAASRHWISQIWRDCRQCGLDCWSIDGGPLAMARTIGLTGHVAPGRRVLVVDWGYSNVTLTIVGEDRPLYSRRVHKCGFGGVLDALMKVFDVTLDEAQHLADSEGLGGDGAGGPVMGAAILDAASESLDELARQVKRTLSFMETQRKHLQPESVWMVGGGASLRNVGPYLQNVLGLPVNIWELEADPERASCAAANRAPTFGIAAALSASAWRAA